jgi:hypothetical protein
MTAWLPSRFRFTCYLFLGLFAGDWLNAANFPIDIALTPTKGARAHSIPRLDLLQSGGIQEIQDVRSWLVLGPYGPIQGPIDKYWEALLGPKKDQELQPQDILKAIETGHGPEEQAKSDIQDVVASGPASQIYFDDALSLLPISTANARRAVYASCEIFAPKSGDFALFVRSDGAIRLWVNNSQVFTQRSPGDEYAEKFRQVVIVHFNKGENFLLAHVVYDSAACGLWLAVSADINAAIQRVADALDQRLTSAWCFHVGDSIPIELPVSGAPSAKARLMREGAEIASPTAEGIIKIPVQASRAPGVAYLTADVRGVQITQPIFIGDASDALRHYQQEYSEVAEHPGGIELNAALHRCEHLLEPSHFTPGELGWQRKFTTQAAIFEESVPEIRLGRNPFPSRTGEYFRSYYSAIDGSTQYSLVYVPRAARRNGGKLPVVLLTPAVIQNVRPFLDSIYAANGGDWATFRMAEQFGCVVVLPGGRSNAYGNPIGIADMREAVASLGRDLPIDWDRVSVQGWCSGGMYALMLGSFFPDDYASIAVNYTLTTRNKNSYPYDSARLPIPVSVDWLAANDPFPLAANLSGISTVMIHHDVEEKPYNDVIWSSQTPSYAVKARDAGVGISVYCFERPGYYRGDEMELMFGTALAARTTNIPKHAAFFTSQTKYGEGHGIRIEAQETPFRESQVKVQLTESHTFSIVTHNVAQLAIRPSIFGLCPDGIGAVTLNNRQVKVSQQAGGWIRAIPITAHDLSSGKSEGLEGPLSHLLSRPFIVATQGAGSSNPGASRWADKFRARWRSDFFCDCRFKPYEELTQEDWSNLDVLVFCADPAQVLRENGLAGRIELARYQVKLGSQRIVGRAVGLVAIWRNPKNPDHYLAIVASNDALHCELPNLNFAFEGWFDYMAWETTETQKTVVLEADRFDRNWK